VVVQPTDGSDPIGFTGDGVAVNSPLIDGLPTREAKQKITAWLKERGVGEARVNYKLRDWLFSRQRYWGEPFPVIHVDGKPKPLPADALPVLLPEVATYKPSGTGESPLSTIAEWVNTTDPETGRPACAKPTPCRSGRGRAGTTCGLLIRKTRVLRWMRRRKNTGCRWTSMWAGPNMRCCICCTRASGTRCCSTAEW
jgi:hypothetical protein